MDKTEYQEKLEELQEYLRIKDYGAAYALVNTIDWRKVKSTRTLNMVADVYEANKDYEKCRQILLIALNRSSIGKSILYRLTEICIKQRDIKAAQDYYEQYCKAAPRDNGRLLLEYKLGKATNRPIEEQIRLLEEYKEREYTERWAYELALLYSKNGDEEKCVEACDDMILWFSEGKYVLKAMELKQKYKPLSPSQQLYYDKEQRDADAGLVYSRAESGTYDDKPAARKGSVIERMDAAGAEVTKDVSVENTGTLPLTDDEINNYPVTSREFMGGKPDLKQQLEKSIRDVYAGVQEAPKVEPPKPLSTDEYNIDALIQETQEGFSSAAAAEATAAPDMMNVEETAAADDAAAGIAGAAAAGAAAAAVAAAAQEAEMADVAAAENIPETEAKEASQADSEGGFADLWAAQKAEETEKQDAGADDGFSGTSLESAEPQMSEAIVKPENAEVIAEPESSEETAEAEQPKKAAGAAVAAGIAGAAAVGVAAAGAAAAATVTAKTAAGAAAAEAPAKTAEEAAAAATMTAAAPAKTVEEAAAAAKQAEEAPVQPAAAEQTAEAPVQPAAVENAAQPAPKPQIIYDDREIPDPEPTPEERRTHTIPLDKVGHNTIPISIEEVLRSETPEERRIRILNNAMPTRMSDAQRQIFTYFARIPGMDTQILEAMTRVYEHAGEHTSKNGNICIMGAVGTGKSRLSQGLIAAMCQDMELSVAKTARLTGERMNMLDAAKVVSRMAGGFLIIENASDMSSKTVENLNKAMEFRTDCMILIIEDEKTAMRAFLKRYPEFEEKFSGKISIPVFTNDELVTFARTYCAENNCQMDELGVLALYSIISNGQSEEQPMTISEVKTIIDGAMSKAKRGGRRGRKSSSREKMVILYEKDFA